MTKKKPTDWLYTLEQELHPQRLMLYLQEPRNLYRLMDRIDRNMDDFRPCLSAWLTSSQNRARTMLLQVVGNSDTIYGFLTQMATVWNKSPHAHRIRKVYRSTLDGLESLVEDCGTLDTGILQRVPLTAYSLTAVKMRLRGKLALLKKRHHDGGLNETLSGLLMKDLSILLNRKGLTSMGTHHAAVILDELEALDNFTTNSVEELLIRHNFNSPAFFRYWISRCNEALTDASGLHRQLDTLIAWEDRLNNIRPSATLGWLPEDQSIYVQFKEFLREKKAYINQRIKLRRAELRDEKLAESAGKVMVNLSVAQFSLFIRLFMEKGVLPKENMGAMFVYFVTHFRTPKTPSISSESLQKKSTDVEYATAKKVKGYLIGMVNWINERYNQP